MLQRFVIGTLTSINSVLSPLAGDVNPNPVYQLGWIETGARCPIGHRGILGLKIDSNLSRELQLKIEGDTCRVRPHDRVSYTLRLPADLLDSEFARRLPVGAAYVAQGVKITRESNEDGFNSTSRGVARRRALRN